MIDIDFTWKIFSQTGNIETYLLFKELEHDVNESVNYKHQRKEAARDPQL